MAGQNILEGVAILHETIQELHRKNLNVVIFKIDFEKAYDKDQWPFPFQIFLMKAFSSKWRNGNTRTHLNGNIDCRQATEPGV